jgi:hypothetical protein
VSDDDVRFHWEDGSFEVVAPVPPPVNNAVNYSIGSAPDVSGATGSDINGAAPAKPIRVRAIVALLLVSLAAVAIASGVRAYRGRTITTTRTIVPPTLGTTGVDAIGCPTGVNCSIAGFFVPGPVAAALRAFPDSTQLDSRAAVGEVDNSRFYFKNATVRTKQGVVVTASYQCIPRGVAISDRIVLSPQSKPTDALLVRGGPKAGCSVAVSAHAPSGVALPITQLERLTSDPLLSAAS